jgi:hypothetical protein
MTVNKALAKMGLEEWLAIRREAGLKIDPETAEVDWQYRHVLDPYEVRDLTPEEMCIGRSYFARAPGSDIWVSFYDLSKETVKALWDRIDAGTLKFTDFIDFTD